MIEISHLRKEYAGVTPLADINTVINSGDVISVIGPSGTGKTTLLRCINLLDRPTGGKIIFNGEEITAKGYDVTRARRKIGMVFQSFNLFDHLTVIENVMTGQVEILGRSRQEAYEKGMMHLKQVGLADRKMAYPSMLSGGQKQRVAIARALAMDPEIILFDEPTSALDPSMTGEVESVIRSLSESGTTMMIVTHDMAFARSICNRVFYLDEGVIYEEGSPEEIFGNPKKEKTGRFIRQLKVLGFKIDPVSFDVHHLYGQIDDFCIKNRLVEQTVKKIRLVVEEICLQILIPELKKTVIKGDIGFYSDTGAVSIELCYEGGKFDPFMSGNKLSVKIIEGMSDIHEYEYDEDSHMNTVKISV